MALLDLALIVDTSGAQAQARAARASVASVAVVLAAYRTTQGFPHHLDPFASEHGVATEHVIDLIIGEHADCSADRAAILEGLEIKPSNRFLELVSALASDANAHTIRVAHGWPVLSVGDRTPTVAEGEACRNAVSPEAAA